MPIKLYSAIGGVGYAMHLTHCGGQVKQAFTCGVCNATVSRTDCGRAVKVGKVMIPISDADFPEEAEGEETNGSFSVIGFSPNVPSLMHLGRPYYMSFDDKYPPRAFQLLVWTMRDRQLCGLIKYMTRGVQNHGVLLPQKDGYFVLHQLVLMEEIRDPAELIFTPPTADKKAVAQMGKMVSDMTVKQLPLADIKNEAAARLRSVIEAKLAEAMKGSSKDETTQKKPRKK